MSPATPQCWLTSREHFTLSAALASMQGAVCALVWPSDQEATSATKSLRSLGMDVIHLGAPDLPYLMSVETAEDHAARMAAWTRVVETESGLICLSARALQRKWLPSKTIKQHTVSLRRGQTVDVEAFATKLVTAGYTNRPRVSGPGEFSRRGDILDLFSGASELPTRIELFDDTIESLRSFAPDTQRTVEQVESVTIPPASEHFSSSENTQKHLLQAADECHIPSKASGQIIADIREGTGSDLVLRGLWPLLHDTTVSAWQGFPPQTQWHLFHRDRIEQTLRDQWELASELYKQAALEQRLVAPVEACLSNKESFQTLLADKAFAQTYQFVPDGNEAMPSNIIENRFPDQAVTANAIDKWLHQAEEERCKKILFFAETEKRYKQVAGLLELREIAFRKFDSIQTIDDGVWLGKGHFGRGFISPVDSIAIATGEDLFGKAPVTRENVSRASASAQPLEPEQLVVHSLHGIGQYKGLTTMDLADAQAELLEVQYKDGTLYLPVYRMAELEPFMSPSNSKASLDKLGGQTWAKAKKGVAEDVAALAEELIRMYALREAVPRPAFPGPDAMYEEFCGAFPHEPTPDQRSAIDAILGDMAKPSPMDRLVCGDVGFGKTEVAMRAAFLAVAAGKQVVVLAPTTVLVEQHYRTFTERFAHFPVSVGKFSRFAKRKEVSQGLAELAAGKLDIAIGTHRLLSDDVQFNNLGLLIIDEEQRFGVKHKEKFKKQRASIDVLSLSATPIPRTLHMALGGVRDLSLITTPPVSRLDVRTYIAQEEIGLVARAITSELARGGQAFLVVPRIMGVDAEAKTIEEWAEAVDTHVSAAKVVVAHGQQSNAVLERAMNDFVTGSSNVLVATSLVENGLDIPRANTVLVVSANHFGMSQLYQIRGRVGRGNVRAYCYLLVQDFAGLTPNGRKRLEALQRHTHLGAGFNIASEDLAIRGGGDVLGKKQSGVVSRVGLHTFTQMLKAAVASIKGQPMVDESFPEMKIDIGAYIPQDYVRDVGERMTLYRRISHIADDVEIEEFAEELADRFGSPPPAVSNLLQCGALQRQAKAIGATKWHLASSRLSLTIGTHSQLDTEAVLALVRKPNSPWKLLPNSRITKTFSKSEQGDAIAKAKVALSELTGCLAYEP